MRRTGRRYVRRPGLKPGWVLAVVAAGIVLASTLTRQPAAQPERKDTAKIEMTRDSQPVAIRLYNHYKGGVEEIELEEYVIGVLSAEMPVSFEDEALKAQAVAARTLAIKKLRADGGSGCSRGTGADICSDSTHCQAWNSRAQRQERWGEKFDANEAKLEAAVYGTAGLILEYQDQPIEVFFHSTAGGMTENSENVFSKALPYLVSVNSPGEESAPRYEGEVTVSWKTFASTVKKAYPDANVTAGAVDRSIGEIVRFESGRIQSINVGGQSISGKDMRRLFGLDSANFTLDVKGDSVVFHTRGFGHGVGMSQTGANSMAAEGADFEQILKHYYTGVDVVKIRG